MEALSIRIDDPDTIPELPPEADNRLVRHVLMAAGAVMRAVDQQWLEGHPEREALRRDLLVIILHLNAALLTNLLDGLGGAAKGAGDE